MYAGYTDPQRVIDERRAMIAAGITTASQRRAPAAGTQPQPNGTKRTASRQPMTRKSRLLG